MPANPRKRAKRTLQAKKKQHRHNRDDVREKEQKQADRATLARVKKAAKKTQQKWRQLEVSEDAIFNFDHGGFCRLEVLDPKDFVTDEHGLLQLPASSYDDDDEGDGAADETVGGDAQAAGMMNDASAEAEEEGAVGLADVNEAGGKDSIEAGEAVQKNGKNKKRKNKKNKKQQQAEEEEEGQDQEKQAEELHEEDDKGELQHEDEELKGKKNKKNKNKKKKQKKSKGKTTDEQTQQKEEEGDKEEEKPDVADDQQQTEEGEQAEEGGARNGGEDDEEEEKEEQEEEVDMSAWLPFGLHSSIMEGLQAQRFTKPTPVQEECLQPAIQGFRDIVACAETGSGKTLAFGLPVIQHIINLRQQGDDGDDDALTRLKALVVCPTRELAIQVRDHLVAIAKHCGIRVVAIVGGISVQKQRRLLAGRPEIIVGTPGRLWDLIAAGNDAFHDLRRLRFLVIDEADRMVEQGHFKELENILRKLPMAERTDDSSNAKNGAAKKKKSRNKYKEKNEKEKAAKRRKELQALQQQQQQQDEDEDDDYVDDDVMAMGGAGSGEQQSGDNGSDGAEEMLPMDDSEDNNDDDGGDEEEEDNLGIPASLFLNPADDLIKKSKREEVKRRKDEDAHTLQQLDTLDADQNAAEMEAIAHEGPPVKRQTYILSATLLYTAQQFRKRRKNPQQDAVSRIVKLCGLRSKYKQVDLVGRRVEVTSKLSESRILCTTEEKDVYLYYFVHRHPGRTIVFVNSIDNVHRIVNLFRLLNATNVWGLHSKMQQRKRLTNLERFRASPSSVLIATDVAARGLDIPDVDHVLHYQLPRETDKYVHRSGRTARADKEGLSVVLQGPQDTPIYKAIIQELNRAEELPRFEVDLHLLPGIRKLVSKAKTIIKLERALNKPKSKNASVLKAAREADLEVDDSLLMAEAASTDHTRIRLATLKAELASLLQHPISAVASGRKYTAQGDRSHAILEPDKHSALSKVRGSKRRANKKRRR
ncbi:hypothetical protein PTSG_12845 [Salpingoeca rosetta]|uniref:ATP-dependent RNA helicase n=1 Tax=Salpingoeca rosetta (strain ATCC 50818 / BSB-021) TaxID=946362 RepID=F2UN19_SALR5|nr:uncharacterized protein PTSG_12845 [Salpingoeca rosetta]EGD78518.1 hypothetical protein PTSG_12845 [Salpingoeca rosetta]|eukprot:XP_004989467.1 hypothetical protein PTSG_12845 [Salpingoeca rosetta]